MNRMLSTGTPAARRTQLLINISFPDGAQQQTCQLPLLLS